MQNVKQFYYIKNVIFWNRMLFTLLDASDWEECAVLGCLVALNEWLLCTGLHGITSQKVQS